MMPSFEIRHTHIEQPILTRKLRPYFQAHTMVVLTKQPLRLILVKSNISSSNGLLSWAKNNDETLNLSRFFGQASWRTIGKNARREKKLQEWFRYVYESYNSEGNSVGLIMTKSRWLEN